MARIAVAGLQHETNTFSSTPARLDDFVLGSGWPGLQRGPAMLQALSGMNLPAAGAIEAITAAGHEVVPLVWAAATPSGRVEQQAFTRMLAMLVEELQTCGPLDGLYLDLHGAMATTGHDDGEGALLEAVRACVGQLPLAASLDLHANVSPAMFACCDVMSGYRTYPHVDMAASGARAARALLQVIANGAPCKRLIQLDTLLPLTSQCTLVEPAASLYAQLEALEHQHEVQLSLTLGFALADIADCGPAILAYGRREQQVEQAARALQDAFQAALPAFDARIHDAHEAVQSAREMNAQGRFPIILADTQDNPGGGGQMDTTGLLQALIAQQAQGAVVAMLYDPEAAALAHAQGIGATLDIALGGKLDGPGSGAAHARYQVLQLSAGEFTGSGPMWGGMPIRLGPMALLQVGSSPGVRVIVASRKMQAADQSILTHFGIDPGQCQIIALKSSVHFRADFDRLAAATLVVASPGAVVARLAQLPYRHLRPGMRLLG